MPDDHSAGYLLRVRDHLHVASVTTGPKGVIVSDEAARTHTLESILRNSLNNFDLQSTPSPLSAFTPEVHINETGPEEAPADQVKNHDKPKAYALPEDDLSTEFNPNDDEDQRRATTKRTQSKFWPF